MRGDLRAAALATLLAACSTGTSAYSPPAVTKVVLVMLENQNYDRVMRHPTFRRLATEGLLFTNAHAHYHPSYPNYIGLVAGQVPPRVLFRVNPDEPMIINVDSIADRLEAKGKTWRNYAEAYPGDCRLDAALPTSSAPLYVRRHVPFLSFARVVENPARCANVVSAEQFEFDRRTGALPHFSFYSPDMCHSGHGSPACRFREFGEGAQEAGLDTAAVWLEGFINALRSDPASWSQMLLIATFDEADYFRDPAGATTNQIYMVFLGEMVRPGEFSEWVSHYRVLRTIGYVLGTEPVGPEDSERTPVTQIWK